jgi:hypothetical protein
MLLADHPAGRRDRDPPVKDLVVGSSVAFTERESMN